MRGLGGAGPTLAGDAVTVMGNREHGLGGAQRLRRAVLRGMLGGRAVHPGTVGWGGGTDFPPVCGKVPVSEEALFVSQTLCLHLFYSSSFCFLILLR